MIFTWYFRGSQPKWLFEHSDDVMLVTTALLHACASVSNAVDRPAAN